MKRIKRFTEPLSVFVGKEMKEQLENIAREKQMTVSEVLRELIKKEICDLEGLESEIVE